MKVQRLFFYILLFIYSLLSILNIRNVEYIQNTLFKLGILEQKDI